MQWTNDPTINAIVNAAAGLAISVATVLINRLANWLMGHNGAGTPPAGPTGS